MEVKQNLNQVTLRGMAESAPVLSHENHGENFYKFALLVPRLSGQTDRLNILAGESLLRQQPVQAGMPLAVFGQLRSFNNRSGEGSRLVISVFARMLAETREEPCNRIFLSGTVCKMPVLRRTPLGRSICDVMLAVNRRYGRADYLPCIAWGQVAVLTGSLDTGSPLSLEGRVQSRIYTKVVDGVPTERTAYEVSIMHLSDENGTEE